MLFLCMVCVQVPVSAAGKECQICLMDEHDEGTQGVACDNEHFMCEVCFGTYVQSECDVKDNTANVLLNGGRVLCPCKVRMPPPLRPLPLQGMHATAPATCH